MVLGIQELHRLVKEQNLVENLSQRELENPEGAGFDLRIGEVYKIKGKGFLGIEERITPDIKLVSKYDENKTIASFIGFAPPEQPKLLMLVKLTEPSSSPWAAETAAPGRPVPRAAWMRWVTGPARRP